jgi:endonuclease YncB( thermonuclease family)
MAFTGWVSEPVAEIRTRISTLNSNMLEFDRLVNRTKEASNYKFDLTTFYLAAREKIFALSSDLDQLKKFLKDHRTEIAKTENPDYYDLEIQHFIAQIAGLSEFITTPGGEASGDVPGTGGPNGPSANKDPSWEGVCSGVEDGDTLWVTYLGGTDRYIRLAGINAPEGGTERGKLATKLLSDLVLNKKVRVNVDFHSPFELYGRWLGTIMLHRDNDTDLNINVEMVRRCMAVPLLKYGTNHFVDGDEIKGAYKSCIMGFPLVGIVKFYSNPAGAGIWVDGYDTGVKTPGAVEVPVGTHRFTLVAFGCSSLTDEFEVANAEVVPPVYHLSKLPADWGTVIVMTDPADMLVTVLQDNAVIGTAPLILDVPLVTPANLIFRADGYQDVSQIASSSLGIVVRYVVPMVKSAGAVVPPALIVPSSTT